MQIRSLTLSLDATWPLAEALCRDAAAFLDAVRRAFEGRRFAVQTTRLCSQAVPGKVAGDPTEFSFPSFADSRILAAEGCGAGRLLERALVARG